MTEEETEDERDIELSSLQAIFPELQILQGNPRIAVLDLPVAPSQKLTVTFARPEAPKVFRLPTPPDSDGDNQDLARPTLGEVAAPADKHSLQYLPSLQLEVALPSGYPDRAPPIVKLQVQSPWLPEVVQARLTQEAHSLWEEYGYSQVLFAYIDYLQQEAEDGFGLTQDSLVLPHSLKASLLEYDRRAKRNTFEAGTFDCVVCLEPKKGSACYQLDRCGHVFCIGCLQDFYNNAILEGDVTTVRCLHPDCGKTARGTRKRKRTLHPRELLEIPIERDQVQRFVDLKLKKKLDSDKTVIFCPRKHCQAPARSVKYVKYTNASLEAYPESDSEASDSETDSPNTEDTAVPAPRPPIDPNDRLAICSAVKCAYAFCRVCLKSWHGELLACRPPHSHLSQLSAEEIASYDYIRLHTSPCPTCNSPAQKTHGCNHMICSTCNTHFCYLCSMWLPGGNPYKHFNTAGTTCYMRLWEMEEGEDGDRDPAAADADPDAAANPLFAGRRAEEQAAVFAAMLAREMDAEREEENARAPPQAPRAPRAPLVQRPQPRRADVAPAQPERQPAMRRARLQPIEVDPALRRFLDLAANDEEDGWDSDEMDDELWDEPEWA